MAMDKEALLAYMQQHYLSRQEVLFKLPFSYSIDSFWPELLNRRKAKAVILPLYNASGMPYWYVLTDSMIKASERLCEEALRSDRQIDPYRSPMTSAMTEEMFFTSFVEGAQIPLQEAMDFLQRGTEPENIQEQMIWNNRHAWTELMGTLYLPLDEQLIKRLAMMLTEEMDGYAEDYRQTDQHPIAAMKNEIYDLPSAFSLPDRMREYCEYLQNPAVHPLIKAAVGQAYILAARPFPEGNERLSRMISSAILLRSGYDFLRDISISSVIARENYRYYKSMCEILRHENGGDMTYFVEYYLEMLTRALDLQAERLRKREEAALKAERELAAQPLLQKQEAAQSEEIKEPEAAEQTVLANEPEEDSEAFNLDDRSKGCRLIPYMPLEKYLAEVDKLKHSPNKRTRTFPAKIRYMAEHGLCSFTTRQWGEKLNVERKLADYECHTLYNRGLLDRHTIQGILMYSLRITELYGAYDDAEEPSASPEEKEIAVTKEFREQIVMFEKSNSAKRKLCVPVIRKMLKSGKQEFSTKEWGEMSGMDTPLTRDVCEIMLKSGLIVNVSRNCRPAVYRFQNEATSFPPIDARCSLHNDKEKSLSIHPSGSSSQVNVAIPLSVVP